MWTLAKNDLKTAFSPLMDGSVLMDADIESIGGF